MAYTYHGTNDLIALPNRVVQTFPSGLVRIERSFVCKKSQVAKYRNTLKVNEPMPFDNGAPAIDGIYIFPEPQEVVRDDGFVEFRVTAYGRSNTSGNIETRYALGSFGCILTNSDDTGDPYNTSQIQSGMMPSYLQKIVLSNDQIQDFSFSIDVEIVPANVAMKYVDTTSIPVSSTSFVPYTIWENYMMTGPSPGGLLYNNTRLYPYIPVLPTLPAFVNKYRQGFLYASNISSTNFGIFNEYVITYSSSYNIEFRR